MTLTRRELLLGFAASTAASGMAGLSFGQDTQGVRIDAARLQRMLEGLSLYGRPAGGASRMV